jgi:uncharacterized protein (DUF488 family)
MKLYTIGFTQKSAETFFGLLRQNGIQLLVDIRLKPDGQLAGFAKRADLPYFLHHLADGCQYLHFPRLAPTKEILETYRSNKDWATYEKQFIALMDERNIPASLDRSVFEKQVTCLLCSEASPQHCHRRFVAERLARSWGDVEIIHL